RVPSVHRAGGHPSPDSDLRCLLRHPPGSQHYRVLEWRLGSVMHLRTVFSWRAAASWEHETCPGSASILLALARQRQGRRTCSSGYQRPPSGLSGGDANEGEQDARPPRPFTTLDASDVMRAGYPLTSVSRSQSGSPGENAGGTTRITKPRRGENTSVWRGRWKRCYTSL